MSRACSIESVSLGVEQTVPRSLVHKRSLENVLLTDVRVCGDDRFLCAGRVPMAHRFFNHPGRTPQKDILFYTELGRQATQAISHAFLDVCREDVCIFERSSAVVTDAAWTAALASPLDPVVIEVRIRDTRWRNNTVRRAVAEYTMSTGGEEVFRGTGTWTVQPAASFQRLRGTSTTRSASAAAQAPPDTCACVDRRQPASNVVITGPMYAGRTGAFVASLIVDHTHPYFFDHPCDHVPETLLLEGCAQLAVAAMAGTTSGTGGTSAIRTCDINVGQVVECEVPTTLTAQVSRHRTVDISISQQRVVARTTMGVAFPA